MALSRLKKSIGSGTILTSAIWDPVLEWAAEQVEQRNAEKQRREDYHRAYTALWEALVEEIKNEGLESVEIALNQQKVISVNDLKLGCSSRGIPITGSQIDLANRLLEYFDISGRILPSRNRKRGREEVEDSQEADDEYLQDNSSEDEEFSDYDDWFLK